MWKDILVHTDEARGCAERLQLAVALAKTHGAHLTGLYKRTDIDPRLYVEPSISVAVLNQLDEEMRRAEAAAHDVFASAVQGVTSSWRPVDDHFTASLAGDAHYADLVIVGQSERGASTATTDAVLLGSGRPVLFVPYIGAAEKELDRVLIAWSQTRESARAVHDALPLLERARETHVLSVARHKDDLESSRAASETLVSHLGHHGIEATAHFQLDEDMEVSDAILSRAADLQANAIVMGAYGHSKLREWVLGGATRGLLEHMTVPVLMSH